MMSSGVAEFLVHHHGQMRGLPSNSGECCCFRSINNISNKWRKTVLFLASVIRKPASVIGAGLWSASLGLAFNPNDHVSRYSVWFPPDLNPRPGSSALSGISGWSVGVRVSMGAGHVMAYTAIGLR